ncbi:two component transcriptional regulator, LytTR family [Belliella buryatensis]|uniref:Two component transcriptional regulator, LytTR family n=1 Tax=Belliella buryatensis TaxID=1500549 RepID=A0A239ANH0_9BACT|nr:LytTR family DNA-binding domain-containing protein [Belliella buryatensis]SNR96911.1 two component transcriptional regulator, LytTR family [Belliella buryatensis]
MTDSIKIIYVDDEDHSLDTFQYMIEKNTSGAILFKRYKRPDLFLEEWKQGELSFDLLFLDIEMFPLNGIQLLLEMKKINSTFNFDLVFLTAYDDFALDAFRHNAIDYLLKPLMIDDFLGCLEKWKHKKIQKIDPIQIELLRVLFDAPHKKPEQLAVPTMDGYEIIEIRKIIRCEAERNYSHIYLSDNSKSFLVSKNLKELENALTCNGFLRIHHSHLINPTHLKRVLKTDGGIVEMIDNTKIRISRNKNLILESIFNNISKI